MRSEKKKRTHGRGGTTPDATVEDSSSGSETIAAYRSGFCASEYHGARRWLQVDARGTRSDWFRGAIGAARRPRNYSKSVHTDRMLLFLAVNYVTRALCSDLCLIATLLSSFYGVRAQFYLSGSFRGARVVNYALTSEKWGTKSSTRFKCSNG